MITYLLIKFIVAGLIIVGVTLIVQHIDPKYGGILAAAPITTTLAFLFTYSSSGQDITRMLVLGCFYFTIPTVLFILSLYFLLSRFSFLPSMGGAYLIWLAGVVLMNYLISGYQ